jgi:DNA mismatch repair protein MutH
MQYNPEDKSSIFEYAKLLRGRSLREACNSDVLAHEYRGKGNYGQVLERFYFEYNPNSESEPDFPVAGVELKSTPLKKLKNLEYRAKERLVLNIINYLEVVNQDFATSSFYGKNSCLLLVMYLYDAGVDILDYVIKLVDEWSFPATDLEVIKKDWEFIRDKVRAGKAHELSEGDTFYLGACTKGANNIPTRVQPFSDVIAMQRAFSFKQGYLNHIIASIATDPAEVYGKLIPTIALARALTLNEIVVNKFAPYLGLTIDEIVEKNGINLNVNAKNFYASLTKAILGIELDKEIEEFEKAEIITKTVRLKANNLPKEDISFPTFNFEDIIHEDWVESDFKGILEHKFLLVFFQFTDAGLVLRKVKFWNMPFDDIEKSKEVWAKTKEIIASGNIVRAIKDGRRLTYFPGKAFSKVAHVRPHATNADHTNPLPVPDKLTGLTAYTKQCFWLNNSYIRDEIYLKD